MIKALVAIPSLLENYPTIRTLLGDDWLKRRLEAAHEASRQIRRVSPSELGRLWRTRGNPVVSALFEAERSDDARPLLRVDMLERDLQALGEQVPNDLQQRLRDGSDSFLFELRIGAGMVRLGHTIEWLPDEGVKRPEFILDPDSAPVSVECKLRSTLDGYERDASQFWNHLQDKLHIEMQRHELGFWLDITATKFQLGDVERVRKAAVELMRSASTEAGTTSAVTVADRYEIECYRLTAPGGSMAYEVLRDLPHGSFAALGGRADRSQVRKPRIAGDLLATGPVRDPFFIRLELVDDSRRRVRGVVQNLKAASKQVRLGNPSLVYIDLNLGNYEREVEDFAALTDAVRSELARAYTRVSAVVLVSTFPGISVDGVVGRWVHTEFIPQLKSAHPLPPELRVPGDSHGSHWLPGEWRYYP